MNNFEKRLFLDYLSKLLPETDFRHYNFDQIFEFFLREFNVPKKIFELEENEGLVIVSNKERDKFLKTMNKVVKNLSEKIKPQNTLLEKQFLMIKDIYHLNNDEYKVFLYSGIKEINNIFDMYFDCVNGNTFATFAKEYLKIRVGKKERITNKLYIKNIITHNRGDVEINEDLLKIFDNPNCNSSTKIMNTILGKTQKSKLCKKDYAHKKKDFDIVKKIITSAVEQNKTGINILLYGGVGTGKTEFAKLVCNSAKIPVYEVKTVNSDFEEAGRSERLVDLYSKQYVLANTRKSCILFDEAEDVMNRGFGGNGEASKGYLNDLLDKVSVPVIWTTNNIYDVDPAFLRRMTYCVEFEKLSEQNRLSIWHKILKKNQFKVDNKKIEELNKNYDIPPSLISNAVQTTKMIGGNEDDFEGFIENVAKVVTKKKNVKTKKEFEVKNYDINLVNTDIDMDDLTKKIQKSGKLNFSLCMYGEPGTGKSLYARYLADTLGIEVVFKRASDLISKWVGETEQNIAAAFEEAKSKKAMLIFDEADTFLQNRNNAQRSWEISQVNEMLTWMESHEYPFVCTTNLLDSLDEASLRRFTFKIRFNFMTNEQVNLAIEHFFGIQDANVNIKGLTAGDFATVKKKIDFLGIKNLDEITKMLNDEVKVKKSKELQNSIGF